MSKLKYQYLLILGLAILLGILAFFQYKWVSQISEAEKERLQKRLEIDTQHFADDFNRIVQNAYFTFQANGENWNNSFLERYQIWQKDAPYPQLIKDFYIVQSNNQTARFERQSMQFVQIAVHEQFSELQNKFEPIDEKKMTLTMPIYDQSNQFSITQFEKFQLSSPIPRIMSMPNVLAFLVIKLDEDVIKNQILGNLNKKHFPDGDFKISIVSRSQNIALFQTEKIEKADFSVPMFELMPENLAFFVNKDLMTTLNNSNNRGQIILNQRFETRNANSIVQNRNGEVKIQVFNGNANQVFDRKTLNPNGLWTLDIQHQDGSLANFVSKTRNRNLLISFGILGLLGGSVGIIFLSAYRAQVLAQRQIDFVSAVSHEFRTPIAVIYSAGENLADGVARQESQVSRYGNLIKGEGKKLAGMVEQILEFAGAKSAHKKYDFREVQVIEIIEDALEDCSNLIAEKEFEIETDFQENLPTIQADKNALSHAVQNLIINSIKYSNGSNWLKISAKNGSGAIKIAVEDKGIGISKKDLKQIFSPFYRAKNVVDAQIHGNGLGLSLVKQTVDAHQGKIRVESEIGKGSRFTIELPQML